MGFEEHEVASNILRTWLRRGLSQCAFAAAIAAEKGGLAFAVKLSDVDGSTIDDFNDFIDSACAEGTVPILLFPRIRTPEEIARLLRALHQNERWACGRVPWKRNAREGMSQVSLIFTAGTMRASAMGFAPLGSMPVTRRSPYVAIGLWAGTRSNPHVGWKLPSRSDHEVGFVDAPPYDGKGDVLSRDQHDSLWETSRARTKDALRDPAEDARQLKDVSFCLPDASIAWLEP